MKKIAFDDLPQYTPWVSRILNGEEQHKKTPSEVQREYNAEKWHSVQQYLDAHPSCSLAELNATLMPDRAVAGLAENKQYVLQLPKEYYQQQIAQYCAVLEKYLEPGDTITELGAGYGAVILQLAKTWGSQYKYRAGEYTDNGLQAMRKLALNEGIALKSGKCDFFTCNMDDALYAGGG